MNDLIIDSDQINTYLQEQIENSCLYHKVTNPYQFIPYYIKLLLLNPKWQIGDKSDIILERINLEKFIKYCTYKLTLVHNTTMETLKLQNYFSYNMNAFPKIVQITRQDLKFMLQPLEDEIIKVAGTDDDTLRELYRKIVYYITLLTGLGDPSDISVYKEIITALHSIFDKKDLLNFIIETSFDKSCDLEELAELVAGIRLFNRDCNRGGIGITDVNEVLAKVNTVLTEDAQKNLVHIMDNVNALTTAIDICFKVESGDSHFGLYCLVPSGILYDDIEKIKDTLIAYRQHEIIHRRLLAEIEAIDASSKLLQAQLQQNFQKLHNLVNHHTAIPAVVVFPIFITIAKLWTSLQNHILKLARLHKLSESIRNFEQEIILNRNILKLILAGNEPLTDAERLERTTGQIIDNINSPDINILFPSELKDFDKLPLKYLGFCAWKFVKSNGGLFPGNPNIGVLEYDNNYYVFSSIEAGKAFASNPNKYINQAFDVIREKPELINLLQLFDELYDKKDIEDIAEYTPRHKITNSVEIQTLIHPIEKKIDKNYKWNVWDLKRQALILANISTCKAHSTQTVKSTFKNEIKIQTYDSKEKTCQTKRDNYTNVPTLSNFIYGLRGRKDDKQFIIELTRPVDE